MERANRMMLRNLKALQEIRREPAPTVAIGQAGQVNIADRQLNVASTTEPPAAHDAFVVTSLEAPGSAISDGSDAWHPPSRRDRGEEMSGQGPPDALSLTRLTERAP